MAYLTPPVNNYDPWITVQWLMQHQNELFVQVVQPKDKPSDPTRIDLVRLPDLTIPSWIYHAKRLHFDSTHPIWEKARWDQWLAEQVTDLNDFG